MRAIIFLMLAFSAFGQNYRSGRFPVGRYFTEDDLPYLIKQDQIPNPAYLIGIYVFVSDAGEQAIFSSARSGLENSNQIAFGSTLVYVTFFGNRPKFKFGDQIVADQRDPLTIREVSKLNGLLNVVIAESHSEAKGD